MMNLKIYSFLIISICGFLSCSRHRDLKKIKEDGYTVEANFVDGKIVDGKASYYDNSGKLVNTTTYKKGIREGIAINYFPNNTVSDSVRYVRDKEHGYWPHFDSIGNKVYSNYYYYGLQYGPELIYEDNRLKKFLFSNFNRIVTVECFYDRLGNLDSIGRFKMNFTMVDRLYENKPVENLFAYLPKIPNSRQSFSIGITNKEHEDKKLYSVEGHDFLIDTLVPIPPSGWYYYIGCNLKANNDSINKFYIEEIISK